MCFNSTWCCSCLARETASTNIAARVWKHKHMTWLQDIFTSCNQNISTTNFSCQPAMQSALPKTPPSPHIKKKRRDKASWVTLLSRLIQNCNSKRKRSVMIEAFINEIIASWCLRASFFFFPAKHFKQHGALILQITIAYSCLLAINEGHLILATQVLGGSQPCHHATIQTNTS